MSTMGSAAVSALVEDVLGRLTSETIKEFGLLWGFKKDVLALEDDFKLIEAVLQDVEDKQIKAKEVALWLNSVRSVSVEVENVLDDISIEAKLQRLHKELHIKHHMISTEAVVELQRLHKVLHNEMDITHRVRDFFFTSKYNKLMFHVKAAHKVKAVRRKLDAIKSRRSELGLTTAVISQLDVGVAVEMPDRETSSLIISSNVFGRDKEMKMVIKKICSKDIGKYENGEVHVFGIWGMGGLGKTTLAQLVYNHEKVNKCFKLKCWVYVSEKFKVKEIIKGIIESIDKCGCTLTQLDMLQNTLQGKLRGKKFLIVLDDVWIEDNEKAKWDELSKTLSCGIEGSIVLMTTRSQTTSQMFAKVPGLQHNLGCLSQEDSWLLFKKFAFAEGREGDDISTLEPIGREIVEKCKGLPLAVKTLGSLMWSKKSTIDWEHVKSSNIWELDEKNILPALKLSYDNLLPHLKRCFAYCCLFPKGYKLDKNVLIPLWVSNGFIPVRGKKSQYRLGEETFNCLVWRSFFQVDGANGFKMHDLMHDLTQHVSRDDCVVIEPDTEVIISNEVLHLTLSSNPGIVFSSQDLRKVTSLRSVLVLRSGLWLDEPVISQIFSQMYLRALYLTNVSLRTLPTSICKLKHLRYLNLSGNSEIQVLPESIIYLQNLQVLILFRCKELCKLPEGLRYMTNLQHLDLRYCDELLHLPSGIKKLTSLRILSKFPVGNKSGAKIGELGDLNLLEGELVIERLEDVEGLNEAESANLKCKTNLSVLELLWSHYRESVETELLAHDEEVLNGLEPNSCLEKLRICEYMGNTISPSWMVKLSNLVEINIQWCKNCFCVPALGRLPKLRVIEMWTMDSLKYFHDDDTTNLFPSLQKLHIIRCSSLVSLPCKLPKLEVLDIKDCGELVSLPGNLPNIRELNLRDCDGLLSLPDEIRSFKDLNQLIILNCKHLFRKYGENVGEDWLKLSHIPSISIEEDQLRQQMDLFL